MGLLDQINEVLNVTPRKYWGEKANRLGSLLGDAASTGAEMYGSANGPLAPEHAQTLGGLLADFTPVVGDVKSAYEGIQSAREGDYLGAGLGALGALPMVPNLGGVIRNYKHGSSKLFDAFDLSAPKTTLGGFSNHGVSLTPDAKTAERYAKDFSNGGGGYVYDVAADVNKPMEMTAQEFEGLQGLVGKIDRGNPLSESEAISLEMILSKFGISPSGHPIDAIKKAGYDAITKDAGRHGMAEREVLLFDPSAASITNKVKR